jgi:hypothetical protein
MNLKTLAVAGLAATAIAFGASTADARTRLQIGVGIGDECTLYGNCYYGGGGYDPGYGYYGGDQDNDYVQPRRRHRVSDYDEDSGRLSCGEARRVLRNQGFYQLEARDCGGHNYRFVGWRNGDAYLIKISSRSGRIKSIRPF